MAVIVSKPNTISECLVVLFCGVSDNKSKAFIKSLVILSIHDKHVFLPVLLYIVKQQCKDSQAITTEHSEVLGSESFGFSWDLFSIRIEMIFHILLIEQGLYQFSGL